MIRINLLPLDKRRPEKPPLTNLLVVSGIVLVIACLTTYLGVSLTLLARKDKEIKGKNKERASLLPFEKQHDSLQKDVELMEQRSKAITEIKKGKHILWSRVVDELCECVANSSTIWLLSLRGTDKATTVRTGPGGGAATKTRSIVERELTLDIQSASEDYKKITEFRELLKERLLTPVISMDEKGTKGSFFNQWNDPLKIDSVVTAEYFPPTCLKTTIILQSVRAAPAPAPKTAAG